MPRATVEFVGSDQAGHIRGVAQPVPIGLDAAEWARTLMFGGDGAMWWSDGAEWHSSADATRLLPTDTITVEVLASGTPNGRTTFGTLQAALEYMASLRPRQTSAAQGTILIKSGHVIDYPCVITNVLLGWVKITSEDAEVLVDEAALSSVMLSVTAGACPVIHTMFTAQPDGLNRLTRGLLLTRATYRDNTGIASKPELIGFRGFDRGLETTGGSFIYAREMQFSGNRSEGVRLDHGSRAVLLNCAAINCATYAVVATRGSELVLVTSTSGFSWANIYRRDAAGLADSTTDMHATVGSVLTVFTGVAGGTGESSGVWSNDRLLNDFRITTPKLQGVLKPLSYTVAAVPSAAALSGQVIHVSNGDAGQPCLAVSDGATWRRIALGATVAAT